MKDKTAKRAELYRKRRGRCEYCGVQMRFEDSTIDHWKPKAKGGTDRWDNLVLSCEPCNVKKAGMTPWEWITRHAKKQSCTA